MTIQSIYSCQLEALDAIRSLHAPDGFDCDLTFGNGSFWTRQERPRHCYDISPLHDDVEQACSMAIPHDDTSLGNVIFDPPFLTYVRSGRSGNGPMIMARRFGGYWSYGELEEHYTKTLDECRRVMRPGAMLVFKCQDIVHNHRLHPTHMNVTGWAEARGFRLKDLFVIARKHRLPAPNRNGKQKHARIFHSYFVVLQRMTPGQERAAVRACAA